MLCCRSVTTAIWGLVERGLEHLQNIDIDSLIDIKTGLSFCPPPTPAPSPYGPLMPPHSRSPPPDLKLGAVLAEGKTKLIHTAADHPGQVYIHCGQGCRHDPQRHQAGPDGGQGRHRHRHLRRSVPVPADCRWVAS